MASWASSARRRSPSRRFRPATSCASRARKCRTKVSGYLEALYAQNPEAVGGNLPDDGFLLPAVTEGSAAACWGGRCSGLPYGKGLPWPSVSEILVASPAAHLARAPLAFCGKERFISAVLGSLDAHLRGLCAGAGAGHRAGARFPVSWCWVRALLHPVVSAVKATPVASVRDPGADLDFLEEPFDLHFLPDGAAPSCTKTCWRGLDSADAKLLEMATAYSACPSRMARIRAIYLPAAFPFLLTAVRLSLGMCWKAGIAAEVIAQPRQFHRLGAATRPSCFSPRRICSPGRWPSSS